MVPNKVNWSAAIDSETIGTWSNGTIGAVQKGNAIYLGTSLGASFHENYENNYDAYIKLMSDILDKCGIEITNKCATRGVYRRGLVSGDTSIEFIFNRTDLMQKIRLDKEIEKIERMTDFSCSENKGKGIEIDIEAGDVVVFSYIPKPPRGWA